MQPQRVEPEPVAHEASAAPWLPSGVDVADAERGWYATVDDLDEGLAIVVATRWPDHDRYGRVRFQEDGEVVSFELEVLQARVDELRRASGTHGEAVASRPLRIGDAFCLVPSDDADLRAPWERLVDVTGAARELSKVSLYGAVAPRLTPDQAAELEDEVLAESAGPSAAPPPRTRPGPTATPGV